MEKSIHTRDYRILLELLREKRRAAGLTQIQIAQRLGQSQSLLSKYERGEVRIDVIQLRQLCHAIGIDFMGFLHSLEKRLKRKP